MKTIFHLLEGLNDQNIFCFSQLLVDRGAHKKWTKPAKELIKNEKMDEYLMCPNRWAQTSTQIVSSSLAKNVNFDENPYSSQDTDFSIRCRMGETKVVSVHKPFVNMNHIYDPKCVSSQKNHEPLKKGLNQMHESYTSDCAYWAYRGRHISRIVSYRNRISGISDFMNSLLHRPYNLKMSVFVFLQIAIPQNFYQKIATFAVQFFGEKK